MALTGGVIHNTIGASRPTVILGLVPRIHRTAGTRSLSKRNASAL
jgi:hypothetical protein